MAVLSRNLEYLFIMAPRTGCTAVSVLLCKQREGWWFPEEDLLDEDGEIIAPRKHTTVRQLLDAGLLGPEDLDRLFVFTSVRNTFDSLVSLWVKKRTSYQPLLDDPDSFVHRTPGFADDMEFVLEHSFSEWIEHQYGDLVGGGRPRHLYSPFLYSADHVMRFENLQADLDEVMEHLWCDPIEIPLLNPTEGREDEDYRSYYTDHARAIIEAVFAADLERFGYRFDEPDRARIQPADRGIGRAQDRTVSPVETSRVDSSPVTDSDEIGSDLRADSDGPHEARDVDLEHVRAVCPACDRDVHQWAPGPGGRPEASCPNCGALERHRFLACLLHRFGPLVSTARNVVDVAPQAAIRRILTEQLTAPYFGIDLSSRLATDARADLAQLPFQDASVEVMICYHVLEHVPDDRAAIEELSRVLAPAGFALVQSPRRRGTTTDEDPSASVEERIERFGQADHVRLYGDDFEDRLAVHGLRPTVLRPSDLFDGPTISLHGLDPTEEVWLCRSTRPAERSFTRPNVLEDLRSERERRIETERRADHWERQYRRIREHPVVRVLAPLRRRVRDFVDEVRD